MERPWGRYIVLYTGPGITVKILRVSAGSMLSLQLHEHRDETWWLLDEADDVRLVINGETLTATPGVLYHVPRLALHRIVNDSPTDVRILEVMRGEYDEDDIVRVHDKYGRA